eukprot:scaffold15555_cov180-Amphora_coffeaeformis.AAC.7
MLHLRRLLFLHEDGGFLQLLIRYLEFTCTLGDLLLQVACQESDRKIIAVQSKDRRKGQERFLEKFNLRVGKTSHLFGRPRQCPVDVIVF